LFQSFVVDGKKDLFEISHLQWGIFLSSGFRVWYGLKSDTKGGRQSVKCFGANPLTILKNIISLCLVRLSFNGIKPDSSYNLGWLVPRTAPIIDLIASKFSFSSSSLSSFHQNNQNEAKWKIYILFQEFFD